MVKFKKEALFLVRDLWASSCSSVLVTEHTLRELISSAWLMPRPVWKRTEDTRTAADKLQSFTLADENQRSRPLCIYDACLVPFAYKGVSKDGAVAAPYEEDRKGGFKAPKPPPPSADLHDDSVWLSKNLDEDDQLQPR